MKNPPFYENVIIITGASRGIGRELALQLADQGAWLVLAARDKAKLEEVASQCRQHGGKALVVPTDVADQAQCQNLIACTAAEYGRIDTLINNAGITMRSRFDNLPDPGLIERIMHGTAGHFCPVAQRIRCMRSILPKPVSIRKDLTIIGFRHISWENDNA